jgi:uncharacterized protein (TIGR03118 family)
MRKRALAWAAAVGLLVIAAAPAAAHDEDHHEHQHNRYAVTNLVTDDQSANHALHEDPNLVNGWGIVASPTSPWWVAANHTDTSILYNGAGDIQPLVVKVTGGPTGTVFNGTADFVVSSGGASGAARFLFATEGGQVLGWNPTVPGSPVPSTTAFVGATVPDAIYKGLAIAQSGGANYLYAADFHGGKIDVFNGSFALQHWADAFVDPRIPHGFAPFNVQALNGWIFVTYAKQDADKVDEIAGRHLGYVSAFTTDGSFVARVASRGPLNAPWGLAWAPSGFGKFSGDLLVGNFGDGRIHAYSLKKHGFRFHGTLRDRHHRAIRIDGLWGLGFGNGAGSGPTTTLYFAAGPNDEEHGLFGSIRAR